MQADKYDLTATVLEEFSALQLHCRDLYIRNVDLVAIDFSGTDINFHSKRAPNKFYYRLKNPSQDSATKKTHIYATYKPRHKNSLEEYHVQIDVENTVKSIQRWLDLLRIYDQNSLDPNERFVNKMQDEYYATYEIVEDDADYAPFDRDRQKLLICTLEAFEEAFVEVQQPNVDISTVRQEAIDLKNSLSFLTKNQVVRWLSRISAKIESKGYDYADSFYKEAKKSLTRILVEKGLDFLAEHIPKLIQHLLN